MNGDSQNLSLGEAASHFLANLPPGEGVVSQQEVYRFVRWYGWERPLAGLTASEVANFAERLSLSDTDYIKKLELIRAFLVYVKKEGWSKINLSTHLKAKKAKAKLPSSSKLVVCFHTALLGVLSNNTYSFKSTVSIHLVYVSYK